MEPQNGRAYTIGLQKLIEFNGPISFVKVTAEINSTAEGWIDEVRPQKYIYMDAAIRQGYTNQGQIIGAQIGPGSKSQYLGITGFFQHGTLGIFVQREVLNQNYYYERIDRLYPFKDVYIDSIHHRANLNVGLNASYKIGHILLQGNFTWNRNFNYGRTESHNPAALYMSVPIVDNYHAQLSIHYLF